MDHLEISPHFVPTARDLEEIGYKSCHDIDDDWLLNETQATAVDDLFFRFNDGHFVRFHGEQVLLIEAAPTPNPDSRPSAPRD